MPARWMTHLARGTLDVLGPRTGRGQDVRTVHNIDHRTGDYTMNISVFHCVTKDHYDLRCNDCNYIWHLGPDKDNQDLITRLFSQHTCDSK